MRQSRRAPVLAAAGLVCVALVTLLSIVGNDRAAPRRLVLADPTAVSAMTGDGSDTWRQNVADMWSRSQLSGVPQPSSSRSASTVPTLVLNMPMQGRWSHDPNPHAIADMTANMRRISVRRQDLWTRGPNLTKGIDPDSKTFLESGFVPPKIDLIGNA